MVLNPRLTVVPIAKSPIGFQGQLRFNHETVSFPNGLEEAFGRANVPVYFARFSASAPPPSKCSSSGRYKRIDADPEYSYQLIGQKEIFWLRPEGRWIASSHYRVESGHYE